MTQETRAGPEGATASALRSHGWHATAVRAAFAGGAFGLVVSAVLVVNHLRTNASDPLDSPELAALKKKLIEHPKDVEVKKRIRELDLELRQDFFRRGRLAATGGYLILGGIVVLLAGLKIAAELRKGPPTPERAEDRIKKRVKDEGSASRARLSVGVTGLLLAGSALLLVAGWGSFLTRESLVAIKVGVAPDTYPSPEEIRKNWPCFRGPGGMGVSVSTTRPPLTQWNGETGEGILWKAAVPLGGASSPVVWGSSLFLTGADKTRREVYCFDVNSGELLWVSRAENVPGGGLGLGEVWDEKTFAASTPVVTNLGVFAIFANGDLACFDFEGRLVWAKGLGPIKNGYGHASSLAMYRGSLLVQLDQTKPEDGPWRSKLLALDAATGSELWEVGPKQGGRPVGESWSTPVVIATPAGDQIVTCANPWVISYDPATGAEIWRVNCLRGDVVPSAIYAKGLVFAMMETSVLAAIRPDGTGDVTETHVAWTADEDLSSIPSPVSDGERVFVVSSVGIMTCWEAESGRKLWDHDLDLSFLASPTLVGDRIYVIGDDGAGVVVRAASKYEEIARPELGEFVSATPAFLDGRIYIRGEKHLFCVGGSQPSPRLRPAEPSEASRPSQPKRLLQRSRPAEEGEQ